MKIKISMNPEVSKTFDMTGLMSTMFPNIIVERSEDGREITIGPNGKVLRALKQNYIEVNGLNDGHDDEKFGAVATYFYLLDLNVLLSIFLREVPTAYMVTRMQDFFETEAEAVKFVTSIAMTKRDTDGNV